MRHSGNLAALVSNRVTGGNYMSTKETGSDGSGTDNRATDIERKDGSTTVKQEGVEQDEDQLSLDLIFEILKNERRREVIRYLRDHEQRVTLSDLAEHIAALENDTDVASITSSQRKRVYVGLYQCHLPKMADMGIIDFNQNRGIIELGDKAPQLYTYLDNDSSDNDDWHWYYLTIAISAGVATVFSLFFLSQTLIPMVLTSVATVIAVSGCSFFHWHDAHDQTE